MVLYKNRLKKLAKEKKCAILDNESKKELYLMLLNNAYFFGFYFYTEVKQLG